VGLSATVDEPEKLQRWLAPQSPVIPDAPQARSGTQQAERSELLGPGSPLRSGRDDGREWRLPKRI
jgi:hypothetical protein